MDSVLEAIAQVFLPEAVERWLDDHGTDKVREYLHDPEPSTPDPVWVIAQALDTYPAPLTNEAFEAIWDLLPNDLLKSIDASVRELVEIVREEEETKYPVRGLHF